MKRFMYFSFSMLCLSITALIGFHIGSESVNAQASDVTAGYRIAGESTVRHFVMLSNGDVYVRTNQDHNPFMASEPTFIGNFWGGTVPSLNSSWGDIKGKYDGRE